MTFLKQLRAVSTLKAPIFFPSLVFIIFVTGYCTLFPAQAQQVLNLSKHHIFTHFSWFYVLAVSIFILFLILLCSSRLGDIRLGGDNEVPEYPFLSWIAMLLWKGLMVDNQYFSKAFSQGSGNWTGKHWQRRLEKILSQSKRADVRSFIHDIAQPAFEDLAAAFEKHGLVAQCDVIVGKNPKIEFVVMKENLRNFLYGIDCQPRELSTLVVEDEKLPHIDSERAYEPITYFIDGREGYDVQYMTKDELIADVLKQYERYMNLAMDNTNALMTHDVT